MLGGDSSKRIIGRGKVRLMLKCGRRGTHPGELHIPGLARNLIYFSKMSDASVWTVFENDTCKMVQGVMVLMQGIKIGTLYNLLGKTNDSRCYQTINPKTNEILSCMDYLTMLWHWRLGHIDKKGLRAMHRKGMVKVLPNCSSKFDFCEHCIYGKQNYVSFPSKATISK